MTRPARPQRRADAERSIASILDAAVALLAEQPDAGLAAIADRAGVTRQTVYAHFSSRRELLAAVQERAMRDSVEAIDGARLDQGPADEALDRLVAAGWRTLERHARILEALRAEAGPEDLHDLHAPIRDRLARLIRRGRRQGVFAPGLSPQWAPAAVIALFHSAADEVGAGRLAAAKADRELRISCRRLLGAE